MRELFIYYRCPAAADAAVQQAALAMQARLCARHPALQARLLRRPPSGPATTWMEVYAAPGGVDEALAADIEAEAAALGPWLEGPRHVEVFHACA